MPALVGWARQIPGRILSGRGPSSMAVFPSIYVTDASIRIDIHAG
ncbi:hypothetical protein [Thermodesulfitimonas sp.]